MSFTVSESEKQELAVVFASLILHDDKAEITGENISKILAAANSMIQRVLSVFSPINLYPSVLFDFSHVVFFQIICRKNTIADFS
jgi:hypothetical protein